MNDEGKCNSQIPMSRNRMQNTLMTGSSAIVSAVMILRSDGTRRKRRKMRKARRMRTMPVFCDGTRRGRMDMATTKASS